MILSFLAQGKIRQQVADFFGDFFDVEICLSGYSSFFFVVGRMWKVGDLQKAEQPAFNADQHLAALVDPNQGRLVEIHQFISPA